MRRIADRGADSRVLRHAILMAGVATLASTGVEAQSQDDTAIAEVIVTANRREAAIIDVPQTVTAITSESLVQYNIQSFADYGSKIPNLSFNQGQGGRATISSSRGVTIRGVVGSNTTTMYIDDTAIPIAQNPRIVDIERIEVLKGPQGTLFGAGAIGGTVRIITKRPSLAENSRSFMLQGGFTQGGGSPDLGGNAVANVVVVPDRVAVRAMAFYNHDSGYISRYFPQSPGSATLQRVGNEGWGQQYGASLSTRAVLTDALTADFKLLAQRDEFPQGFPLVRRGLTQYDPTSTRIDRAYDVTESARNEWYLPALTLDYKVGNWTLTSATSYFRRTSRDVEDVSEAMHQVMQTRYGYTFAGGVVGGSDKQDHRFQQEFRAAFDLGTHFSGILGAYYSKSEPLSESVPRIIAGFAESPQGMAAGAANDVYFKLRSDTTSYDRSFFGELAYRPIDQITLTAGVRRYNLSQVTVQALQGFVIGVPLPTTSTTRFKGEGYSPRFTAKFEPDPGLTLYASAAKGFRPGGPGSATAAAPACVPDLTRLGLTPDEVRAGYQSDSVWTYEGGAKKALSAGRVLVTGAVFQTDWSDIQQLVSLPGCGSSFTGNAGAARIRGIEFEFNGSISPNLQTRIGFGYLNAEITDDNQGTTGQKVGDRLYGVPEVSATAGLVYTRSLRDGLDGVLSGDWSYVGDSATTNNSTTFPEMRGAYSLLNLRLGLRQGNREYSLYVNNVTNELANYGDHVPDIAQTIMIGGRNVPYSRVSVSRPRQFGLQVRYGF